MRKLLFIAFSFLFLTSCIKKKAIKTDSDLVGTWINNELYSTWLIIAPDGHAIYRTYEDTYNDWKFEGQAKYSLFESKFYVGSTKFKVVKALSGYTDGMYSMTTRDYKTLRVVNYPVNMKMVLKTSILHGSRTINFYKIAN